MNKSLVSRIDSFLIETQSPVVRTLQDIANAVEPFLKAEFPNSFFTVKCDNNIASGLTIRFTWLPSDKWPNGIFHNANPILIMVSPVGFRYEPDGGCPNYVAEESFVSRGEVQPRMNKKTGPADRIAKYIIDYFKKVKTANETASIG